MNSDKAETIFNEALRIDEEAQRQAYVQKACEGDTALRTKVERILRAHESAGEFLPDEPGELFGTPTLTLIPGDVVDRYKLLEKLGEGGFGSVWAAEQKEPVKRRVALKIIKLGMDTKQVVARFEAERQALAMMDHPNIAKVLDAGATETGRPYFVMELVRGIPITDYCDRETLNTEDRLDLFIKVCQAVQHAHQKGIIHRDLKPSNILVVSHDGVSAPKVIDFGIAKATHQELTEKTIYTKFQEFIGTPSYMSPEQTKLSGLDIDTRSDIYSLGVLLYELLTGSPPFDAKELLASGFDEMRKIIRETDPVKPSTRISQTLSNSPGTSPLVTRHSSLATDLDWIVMKCLEKERTRRYDTANGLANDLVRHLKHEPIVARPPSRAYRLQKSWQRNKLLYTAGTVVALALIAGIAVSTWQATVANGERIRADDSARNLQQNLARQLLHRGQTACEQGKMADGLHWLVRAIEKTPPESKALKREIENNLTAWSGQWVGPKSTFMHETATMWGAFSPDGQRVITGGYDGILTLWSVSSDKYLWREKGHDEKQITSTTFSSDGKRILTSGNDGKTRLWSAETGSPLGQPMDSTNAFFSPDGQFILIRGGDKMTVRLHSGLTGERLFPPMADFRIKGWGFTPDSTRIFVAGENGSVRFWSVINGEQVEQVVQFAYSGNTVRKMRLGPRGEIMATYHIDRKRIFLWSMQTGEQLLPPLWHDKPVRSIEFHPDGKHLLTVSGLISRLWAIETGELIGVMRHGAPVYNASFSPDGHRIATAGLDGTARLWSAETAQPLAPPLYHKDKFVASVLFSPDDRHLLTLTAAPVAYLWDTPKVGAPVQPLQSRRGTSTARFQPGGPWVATGNHWTNAPESGVKLFDANTQEPVASNIVHKGPIWSVCFRPDGEHLATAGGDGMAWIWEVTAQKKLFSLNHKGPVRRVAYSDDGKLIATGSFDNTARIWSASDGTPHSDFLPHDGLVEDVAFGEHAQGSILVTACADGKARVWSVDSGLQILPAIDHGDALLGLDISPDNTLIATGGHDKTVKLWRVSDGQQTDTVLVHDGYVVDVNFSRDGRWLLTSSRDLTVRLWSVESGEQIGPSLLNDSTSGPWESHFSRDEQSVVIADHTNGARLVELPGPLDQPFQNPRLWIEVLTRMTMDEHGALHWTEPDEWQAKRETLAKLGVPVEPQ